MTDGDAFQLETGDCRDLMAQMPESSVDAIVTDPPYGIGFMGKAWDRPTIDAGASDREERGPSAARLATGRKTSGFVPSDYAGAYDFSAKGNHAFQVWCESWASEAIRVLKPGGHMLVCGSPRTYHRLTCGLEDAGFEIRDCLQWLFGSGFPKSLDVVRAIDTAAGAVCAIDGPNPSDEWEGWGTALKPAYEPVVLARKPLQGTVAGNIAQYGVGGLNIDATRIGTADDRSRPPGRNVGTVLSNSTLAIRANVSESHPLGRWPANVLLDAEAARLLDAMSGPRTAGGNLNGDEPSKPLGGQDIYGDMTGRHEWASYADLGGASRFFYTAKSSRREREFGLDDLDPIRRSDGRDKDIENPRLRATARRNDHPTVKPVELMGWLCRLITPPGGLVLDPFLGSGSTGMAALDEGFRFMGIDLDAHYIEIARRRIARRHLLEPFPQAPTDQQGQRHLF